MGIRTSPQRKNWQTQKVLTARNPGPAGAREMATKYIRESEDKKISGGGVRAMRRHGGTMVVAYLWCQKERLQGNEGPVGRSGDICTGYDPP
jgi:hypothetical protein